MVRAGTKTEPRPFRQPGQSTAGITPHRPAPPKSRKSGNFSEQDIATTNHPDIARDSADCAERIAALRRPSHVVRTSHRLRQRHLLRRLGGPYGQNPYMKMPAQAIVDTLVLKRVVARHRSSHHDYGLSVVAVVIGLESIGLPFPGESVSSWPGIFAGTRHEPNIVWVVVVAAVSAIVGQVIGYLIGREFGYRLLLRYGPYVRVTESRIKLGEYLFLRHGSKIIVVARFVPLLRSLAGILAGANRMPWLQFLAANSVGAFAWAACSVSPPICWGTRSSTSPAR